MNNNTEAKCTETGLWQRIDLECRFDPEAETGNLRDESSSSLDSASASVVATIAVLATLVALAFIGFVTFFARKRMTRLNSASHGDNGNNDQGSRKTSTDHLIGSQPIPVSVSTSASAVKFNTLDNRSKTVVLSQFDTFPRQVHHQRPIYRGPVSEAGSRSSGDGGSEVEAEIPPYATLMRVKIDEEDEEDSHYSLIRQPDGLSQVGVMAEVAPSNSDDGGYESLRQHQLAFKQRQQLGLESDEVRDKVHETLNRGLPAPAMTTSSGSDDVPLASHGSIKGIKARSKSPLPLPPPPMTNDLNLDLGELYAKVDPAKKRRRRHHHNGAGSVTSSSDCASSTSPTTTTSAQLSPTKSLIQKFNSMNSASNSNSASPEPMYATIGSKNRSQIASRKI